MIIGEITAESGENYWKWDADTERDWSHLAVCYFPINGLLSIGSRIWIYLTNQVVLPWLLVWVYLNACFCRYGRNMKIIHFIGATKPWLQYFDTESKRVRPSDDVKHLEAILQRWWDIFCSMIHPGLSQDMVNIPFYTTFSVLMRL